MKLSIYVNMHITRMKKSPSIIHFLPVASNASLNNVTTQKNIVSQKSEQRDKINWHIDRLAGRQTDRHITN